MASFVVHAFIALHSLYPLAVTLLLSTLVT